VAWFVLLAVLVSAANAAVRKVFDTSSNAWLELQWVLFSTVFLLCAPWTLQVNEHVRIDIVNNLFPKKLRDSIDVVGHGLFLLPFAIILVITAYPVFVNSFLLNEQSFNYGGLPQWPAKSLIVIGFALLSAQGISELVKRIAAMRGLIPDPYERHEDHHKTEAETETKRMQER
jgi:TRAP-type mannitol/chloroaromatic compound transport system permease small subunit